MEGWVGGTVNDAPVGGGGGSGRAAVPARGGGSGSVNGMGFVAGGAGGSMGDAAASTGPLAVLATTALAADVDDGGNTGGVCSTAVDDAGSAADGSCSSGAGITCRKLGLLTGEPRGDVARCAVPALGW